MDIKKIPIIMFLIAALCSFVTLNIELGILWLILLQLTVISEKLGDKNGTIN